jgi:predicted Zn-dependent protease
MLTEHPSSPRREQAMFFRLESAVRYAQNSIDAKKAERFKEAETYVKEYRSTFPGGTYAADVASLEKQITLNKQK